MIHEKLFKMTFYSCSWTGMWQWKGQGDLILQYNSALLHHFGSTNKALKKAQFNI